MIDLSINKITPHSVKLSWVIDPTIDESNIDTFLINIYEEGGRRLEVGKIAKSRRSHKLLHLKSCTSFVISINALKDDKDILDKSEDKKFITPPRPIEKPQITKVEANSITIRWTYLGYRFKYFIIETLLEGDLEAVEDDGGGKKFYVDKTYIDESESSTNRCIINYTMDVVPNTQYRFKITAVGTISDIEYSYYTKI